MHVGINLPAAIIPSIGVVVIIAIVITVLVIAIKLKRSRRKFNSVDNTCIMSLMRVQLTAYV